MITRGIWIGMVITAFVAGSIMTNSTAFAAEKPNGQPFQALWDAINGLQEQVDSFFDIFTELRETDESLQAQIDAIDSPADLPVFTKHVILHDDVEGHAQGWDPQFRDRFFITDPDLQQNSIITAWFLIPSSVLGGDTEVSVPVSQYCSGETIQTGGALGIPTTYLLDGCLKYPLTQRIPDGSVLYYTITNPVR